MARAGRVGGRWRWLRRNRWLLARRATQLATLAAFGSAAWWEIPVAQGTLAASRWFGTLTLTDPFALLQSMLAGQAVGRAAAIGAALVALPCMLLAGRLFCAWVCPLNLITDAADATRRILGLRHLSLLRADRRLRHVVALLALAASAAFGVVAWELVNPITYTMRAVVFGAWAAGLIAIGMVLGFDLVVLRHGWCGHLCPVGAFYGWLGRFGRLKVHAVRAAACTQCGDCFRICPEPHVITPVLRPGATSFAITNADCLRCGRCLDHCDEDVFVLKLGGDVGASSRGRP